MRRFRSAFWPFLVLLLVLLPSASARAGVFISVGFAPPVLPVYVQPPCPEPNLMWVPGYWAYGDDGYYWVPGAWVPAPYYGALWTPPYWGWSGGLYVFHTGYWGPVVGYYGGVNYGFGYMGMGFVGGEWRGHDFAYNTAVINVNRTYVRNTYINSTIVENHTIVNNNHIAYAGGPGGIQHQPTVEERNAMQSPHMGATSFQQQHEQQARTQPASYFNANHGRPQNLALAKPLPAEHHDAPQGFAAGAHGNVNASAGAHANPTARPAYQQPQQRQSYNGEAQHPLPQQHEPQYHPAPQPQHEQQARPAPQPQHEQQPRPQAEQRPEPKQSQPRGEERPRR